MSERLARAATGVFLGMLAVSVARAADDGAQARQWLARMSQASHTLNYDGAFIYQSKGQLESMRIIHGSDDLGERERLVSLNGPSREVIRDNDAVSCNSGRAGGATRSFPISLPTRLDQLQEHYRLAVAGDDRVAGVPVVRINVSPRDEYRFGQDFWLAKDSGLLLRSETVDPHGRPLERLMFTSVHMLQQMPQELMHPKVEQSATPRKDGEVVWYRQSAETTGEAPPPSRWQVTGLPPGFHKDMQRTHPSPSSTAPVEHMVYSDGLASVSVFIEQPRNGQHRFIGPSSLGAINAFARSMGRYRITVVGEVPAVTVRQMAESVREVGEAATP